jgi:hypothetical protein
MSNITCPRCGFRHPPDRTCEDAALIAQLQAKIRILERRNVELDLLVASYEGVHRREQ